MNVHEQRMKDLIIQLKYNLIDNHFISSNYSFTTVIILVTNR